MYNPGCSLTRSTSRQEVFLIENTFCSKQPPSHHHRDPAMALRPRASSQPGKYCYFSSPKASSARRHRAASAYTGTKLEEELSCTICYEIFKDPVVLKCSHSFCQLCLQQFWNKKKSKRECPICRRTCSLTEPTSSLALKNVADTFLRDQASKLAPNSAGAGGAGNEAGKVEVKCVTHGEVVKLFCLDDSEVLCCVCNASKKHQGHRVCPLEESAERLKVMWLCQSETALFKTNTIAVKKAILSHKDTNICKDNKHTFNYKWFPPNMYCLTVLM